MGFPFDEEDQPMILEWLAKQRAKREAFARLEAAKKALDNVPQTQFWTQCPCCCGRGVLAVLFGAKDDQ